MKGDYMRKLSRRPTNHLPCKKIDRVGGNHLRLGKLHIIAGILAISAACICGYIGKVSLTNTMHPFYTPEPGQPLTPPWAPYPVWAALGLLGFASGMVGGILSIFRFKVRIAMAGIALMIPEGVAGSLGLYYWPTLLGEPSQGAWVIDISLAILVALSMIFAVISRREFTS